MWRFYSGYGADCEVSDLDEIIFTGDSISGRVNGRGRCVSCRAKEAINFLRQHIELS